MTCGYDHQKSKYEHVSSVKQVHRAIPFHFAFISTASFTSPHRNDSGYDLRALLSERLLREATSGVTTAREESPQYECLNEQIINEKCFSTKRTALLFPLIVKQETFH